MVPRYEWMNDFGRSVESLRPVLRHAKNEMNDQENVNEVIKSISMLTKVLREERE